MPHGGLKKGQPTFRYEVPRGPEEVTSKSRWLLPETFTRYFHHTLFYIPASTSGFVCLDQYVRV